ncbi:MULTISPECIES: hypothetical protein [unclassified Xanthomonas]|uniref:hypothetical protein n=1 Tax=unclassified Xanthomonas TaxID=2643310 RepID=UPI002A8144C5|nr:MULTISPECIES: hypothetical protein [unclassified Xanthomonas]MDY4296792.1 hypothetical protein [Xanthomonas sp. LF02-5]MDY4358449.1 hypothetical protein [Xanthomonas sp. LF04-12]
MTNLHPNDKLAALDWALAKAREAATGDDLVRLSVLPALQQVRDDAQRDVRRG